MKSSVLKDGVNAAPQRTLLHALGLTDEEIAFIESMIKPME